SNPAVTPTAPGGATRAGGGVKEKAGPNLASGTTTPGTSPTTPWSASPGTKPSPFAAGSPKSAAVRSPCQPSSSGSEPARETTAATTPGATKTPTSTSATGAET